MNENCKPYVIVIFGKNGCPHCARLKETVMDILKEKTYREKFDLDYQNLSTVDGLIAYAEAETVNGQRIPALQLMRYSSEKKAYFKIPDRRKEGFDKQKKSLCVPVYLQLETDYSSDAGDIRKEDIRNLMTLAETS